VVAAAGQDFSNHTQAMKARTALITGAARRIGACIARTLHREGMNVVIHFNRSAGEAAALRDSLNAERANTAIAVRADLLDPHSHAALIRSACELDGGLDALVNNASAFYPTPVASATQAQWEEIMGSNLRAPFFLAREAASALRASRGCIVNVGDIHGLRPLRGHSIYSIAKAGQLMLTQALAKELAPDIRVNSVAPGAVMWPEGMPEALRQRIVSHTLLKQAGTPEDVANAVRFLILDAGYMTGQTIIVDGGRTLYS
jgi:pteridine reductase